MISRLIRSTRSSSNSIFYFFSTSKSSTTNPSSFVNSNTQSIQKLQSNLKNTLSHIQYQIDKLPVEVQDGTTFSNLYDGVLLSLQQLVDKTNLVSSEINQLSSNPNQQQQQANSTDQIKTKIRSIESVYKYLDNLLNQQLDLAVSSKNNLFKDKILNFDMKLGVVLTMLDKIIKQPHHSSLSLERTQQLLSKHSQKINTNCKSQTHIKRTQWIQKAITLVNATVIYGQSKYKHPLQKQLMFFVNFPRSYYYFNRSSSISIKHYKQPSIENIVKIWNSAESGYNSYFLLLAMKVMYPISVSDTIYIPRKQIESNQIVNNIFKKQQSRIPIRVLIDKQEQIYDFQGIDDYNSFEPYDSIVIHIHGGGFVALSSLTSQSYTRRWAKELKLPIFSINYRLAPNHPFPSALEDVYHSYLFIINQIHKYSNIRFKKVILAGDSAGGNLVAALTGLLLKNKQPVPDSIFLAYPSLDLRFIFSESRIHSFNDPLLFSTMLMSVREAYIKDGNDENPLISPIFINNKFLGREEEGEDWPKDWPKTRIMVGNADPLFDDSIRLLDKLDKSGVDVKLYELNDVGHAFLNMDLVLPECRVGVQKSIEILKQLSVDTNQKQTNNEK